jgi:hypothetical protein
MDHHPVTLEFPADSRTGSIDRTGKSFPVQISPHERAAFHRFPLFWHGGLTVSIVSFNVGKEEFVLYPVPAVKIAAGKLALDFYKRPETRTAFPAQRTIECNHIVDRMLAGGIIKRTGYILKPED